MIEDGTIVKASYADFDEEKRVGLFIILYSERNDNNTPYTGNFIGAKITTQINQCMNYSVPLRAKDFSFLTQNCMITLSKLHTIGLNQIHRPSGIIGKLDSNTMIAVYKEYMRFQREMCRQLEQKF